MAAGVASIPRRDGRALLVQEASAPWSETIIVRLAATADQIGKLASDTTTGDRRMRDRSQAFARHVIDDVQNAEAPTAGELVVHEVQ